ncbi:MAG: type II toxin-antitoxin system HicB family antitoxin [Pseudoflavonifractor sp.]|jgi:predicted HicB family RNase H-like nuclease|uniref:type II toxin-antitoxin system HicB family antitoxin n=1 Tax=Solidesulfovibrio sp. C21 TaxID=3398613 RepID=UPI002B38EDDE|nr:type II toxin-antitoxin system HicB family antitoxin [Pseudoflavonifractor sp.]
MNAMTYKGYTGIFEFIPDDDEFHGRVIGIRDVIHFSGSSVGELRQALADSVEDYLDLCAKAGKTPEKPYSGQFRLRLSPEVHRLLAVAAKTKGKSLNEFVTDAAEKAARETVR